MKAKERVLKYLNNILMDELMAVQQDIANAAMCGNWA